MLIKEKCKFTEWEVIDCVFMAFLWYKKDSKEYTGAYKSTRVIVNFSLPLKICEHSLVVSQEPHLHISACSRTLEHTKLPYVESSLWCVRKSTFSVLYWCGLSRVSGSGVAHHLTFFNRRCQGLNLGLHAYKADILP